MVYTDRNFKSKKELVEAFKSGEELTVFQPGPFGPNVRNGAAVIEGPHYPQAHRFYVSVEVRDGIITKVNR